MGDLRRDLRALQQSISYNWAVLAATMRNQARLARGARLDYIVIPVGGPLPERDEPPRSFLERQLPLPPQPRSMQRLNRQLQAIGDAGNVTGVVFIFRGFSAGLATLQNFRRSVERLRETGKKVVVFTPFLDLAHYYAATAADTIVAPPSAQFDVYGLRTEVIFLKDALERIGIEAEAIQISPYKSAPNIFSKSDMTPEHREQLDWLLDDWYDIISVGMAQGRHMGQDEMKQLIDKSPHFAADALELGLVDHLAYEDELAALLASKGADPEEPEEVQSKKAESDEGSHASFPKIRLKTWAEAYSLLLEKPRRLSSKHIGVISLEGTIMMGPSRSAPIDLPIPFVEGETAGEQTLVRLLRQAEKDDNLAALILHVDSGGGSALASDLIGRQIERIRQNKKVLVYMGNSAASGGYYVGAAAHHIMSQKATVTGSIGVWTLHLSTRELFHAARVNRVGLQRGERAGLYSNSKPLSEEERQVYVAGVADVYEKFKNKVAGGRQLPYEELDSICEGRVWTGRQALERKLVDSHGDFVDAVRKAADLAGLPYDDGNVVPIYNHYPRGHGYVTPNPYKANDAVAEIVHLLSGERLRDLAGKPLLLMPFAFKLK
jgi:protease-4